MSDRLAPRPLRGEVLPAEDDKHALDLTVSEARALWDLSQRSDDWWDDEAMFVNVGLASVYDKLKTWIRQGGDL